MTASDMKLIIYDPTFKSSIISGKRLPKEDELARNELVKDIMEKNKKIKNHEIADSFVYKASDGELYEISKRTVERIRAEYKQDIERRLSKQKGKYEIFELPPIKTLGEWQKLPSGLFGFPEAPEKLNEFFRYCTTKQRRLFYARLQELYEGIGKLHWEYWNMPENVTKIYAFLDERYNTFGLAKKEKMRALASVQAIRKLTKWAGWSQYEIDTNFPAVKKYQPLKKRIGNPELIYFYPEEQWDNYNETIKIIVEEVPNYPKKRRLYEDIYRIGFLLIAHIASDTATRTGIGNDFDNQNVNKGRGILGIRIPDIYYNYQRLEGYTDLYLMDKLKFMWHKVIQPSTTKLLKNYLKLHKEYYPDETDMLFPSNSGLSIMNQPPKYDERKLCLWSKEIISKYFNLVNERFWHLYQIPKGNPNRRREGKVPVTWKTHEYRHNWAVWQILKGRDIITACKRGGWNNVQVFVETYADIVPNFETSQTVGFFGDAKAEEQLRREGRFAETLGVTFRY